MSTSPTNYTSFACPNSNCKLYGQSAQDNIAHHSWMGKRRDIERLRCKGCGKAFSENKNTLREKAKISIESQESMFKCMRWGVCDEGTSDICSVNLKTVQLFRKKLGAQAKTHHEANVSNIKAPAVQVDELRAKQGGKITWIGAAIALQSLLILSLVIGARQQSLADRLLAEIWVRCCFIGMIFSDGWRCYYSAILRCFGKLYGPRSRPKIRGRRKKDQLKLGTRTPFYAQVIKQTVKRYQLAAVKCRSIVGTLSECLFFVKAYDLGNKIHTAHIERWFGTLRCHVASLRRKTRCLGKNPAILSERVWIFAMLHNWFLTHASLTLDGLRRTPAMAAGLIDRPMTYVEWIRLPIFPSRELVLRVEGKLDQMRSHETMQAARRTKRKKPLDEKFLWQAQPAKSEEAA